MRKILIGLFALCTLSGFSQDQKVKPTVKKLPAYSYMTSFTSGYCYVQMTKKDTVFFGFIDKTGQEVVPCTQKAMPDSTHYNSRDFFGSPQYYCINKQGLTVLRKNEQEFLYDVRKKKFVGDGCKHITMTLNNFFALKYDSTRCVMNECGKTLFEVETRREVFAINKNRFFYLDINQQWNFVDSSNKLIKKLSFDEYGSIEILSENRLKFKPRGTYGLLDSDGNVATSEKYDDISSFSEGYAIARIFYNSRTGEQEQTLLIDENGKALTIENKAIRLIQGSFFHEGSIAVEVQVDDYRVQSLMDAKGNLVLKPLFNNIYPFFDGIASMQFNGVYGLIDKTSKLLFRTNNLVFFGGGLGIDRIQNSSNGINYQVIDKQGNVVMRTKPVKAE